VEVPRGFAGDDQHVPLRLDHNRCQRIKMSETMATIA
jgi:hypothetical protein